MSDKDRQKMMEALARMRDIPIYDRLKRAIYEHKRMNAGKWPVRFELHPEHWRELRESSGLVWWNGPPAPNAFMDVPIEISRSAIQPVMVTSCGVRVEI
jgi:hypothetical protein